MEVALMKDYPMESVIYGSRRVITVPIVTTAMNKKDGLFWDIIQRRVVTLYRRFGTTYRYRLQGSRSHGLLALENGTERFSRNVGTELPLCAA
jgi:hypothetical protein